MPFFSRRIGLSSKGQITPIQFAGKVTGRIKDYNIGLLNAVVEGDDHPRNAFVGRVSRNVFEQSSFGFLTTVGDPNSDEMNSVTGIDFQYRNTDFMGGTHLRGKSLCARFLFRGFGWLGTDLGNQRKVI